MSTASLIIAWIPSGFSSVIQAVFESVAKATQLPIPNKGVCHRGKWCREQCELRSLWDWELLHCDVVDVPRHIPSQQQRLIRWSLCLYFHLNLHHRHRHRDRILLRQKKHRWRFNHSNDNWMLWVKRGEHRVEDDHCGRTQWHRRRRKMEAKRWKQFVWWAIGARSSSWVLPCVLVGMNGELMICILCLLRIGCWMHLGVGWKWTGSWWVIPLFTEFVWALFNRLFKFVVSFS